MKGAPPPPERGREEEDWNREKEETGRRGECLVRQSEEGAIAPSDRNWLTDGGGGGGGGGRQDRSAVWGKRGKGTAQDRYGGGRNGNFRSTGVDVFNFRQCESASRHGNLLKIKKSSSSRNMHL